MKKLLILFIFILLDANSLNAQETTKPKTIGVGLQFNSMDFGGLSARYDINKNHGVQVVAGLGSVHGDAAYGGRAKAFTFTGRYLYSFDSNSSNIRPYSSNVRPYLVGQIGHWKLQYKDFYSDISQQFITYGAGMGVEYAFSNKLKLNMEGGWSGAMASNGGNVGYGYSGIFIAGGIHYYFKLFRNAGHPSIIQNIR